MVDKTGLNKPEVDETAIDEPGPHHAYITDTYRPFFLKGGVVL